MENMLIFREYKILFLSKLCNQSADVILNNRILVTAQKSLHPWLIERKWQPKNASLCLCVCAAIDLWEPHQQSLLQWDVSTVCVHVSIESDCWKESCHSNAAAHPVIYSALTVSAFIRSLSDQTGSDAKCRVRGSALKLHWLSSSFQIRAFCGQTWLRLKLVSFQCENRQISRSESTFSFQSRHMHAPQRGVNGLCVELSGVFRECKQRDEELGCTLWVFVCSVWGLLTLRLSVSESRGRVLVWLRWMRLRKMGILGLWNEVAYIYVKASV